MFVLINSDKAPAVLKIGFVIEIMVQRIQNFVKILEIISKNYPCYPPPYSEKAFSVYLPYSFSVQCLLLRATYELSFSV